MEAKLKTLHETYKLVEGKTKWNQKTFAEQLMLHPRTIARIRNGKTVREGTCDYAIPRLYGIIEAMYQNDIKTNGGANSIMYLRMMREMLRHILNIPDGII